MERRSRDDRGLGAVAVVIPAYNEEEALPGVLARFPIGLGAVIVADNGSDDRTAEIARAGGAIVVREEERGYGAACLAGLRALDSLFPPPRIVAFIDGDRSDDPSRLAELVAPIVEGRADMVLGVRRTSGGGLGTVLPHARLGNRVVLALARLMFGRRFRDLPPFRAVDAQRLGDLCMDDRNWGWTLQMQLRAVRHGLRIVELEMPHRRRTEGRSKISGSLTTSLRVGLVMLGTLLREWRRPLPSPPET